MQGESRRAICQALSRSLRWFDKWWAEYRQNHTPTLPPARAPHKSPQQMPPQVIQAVVAARKLLEQAATPATRYGLIGARAIWAHLKELQLCPLPSIPTIQRILAEHHLTHPLGAAAEMAYYPSGARERLEAALFWTGCVYNFCHEHATLEGTPAMAADLTDHVWSIDELLRYRCRRE